MTASPSAAAPAPRQYSAHGPVRGQDDTPVWVVVRQLDGCARVVAVAESTSAQGAWQHAQDLNAAAAGAAVAVPQPPAAGAPHALQRTAWPFPLLDAACRLLHPRRPPRSRTPAGDDAPF